MEVSVIIPAYNEADSLKSLLPALNDILGNKGEIIVVDDASKDDTASVARAMGARVISSPYNMGNGASVKKGLRAARKELVLLMDADGQHKPSDIPLLLRGIDGADMVVGARKKSAHVWWRAIANGAYNILASYVSGVKIEDLTSGFRLIKRDKALKFVYLLPNTFSYPSTLTLSFVKAAYAVKFVEVDVSPREKGRSKINLLNDGLRFLMIIMRIAVFFSPLKIFIPVSLLFFLTGIFYYLHTFIRFNRFTNMSALLITTSIIIFMLGLVSEQIASLRMNKTED